MFEGLNSNFDTFLSAPWIGLNLHKQKSYKISTRSATIPQRVRVSEECTRLPLLKGQEVTKDIC